MRDSEIKNLFAKADEQVHVDEIRKQKTYYAMVEEMEKQRTPMMSTKNILFHQFWYMDKLFFAVYGVLICLGIIFITVHCGPSSIVKSSNVTCLQFMNWMNEGRSASSLVANTRSSTTIP